MLKDHMKLYEHDERMRDTYFQLYEPILANCVQLGLVLDLVSDDRYAELISIGGEVITPAIRKQVFLGVERLRKY